ncbi:DUF2059 domain-containing protein [Sphingomicrobium lutaoense]|uniref:DUF2059 domain-containing protein n=1 Tax=Sphingomicrobium lutaoense TaxID=515949 RepID=A0A839YZ90_9SPHN|nr:DUF2059 domain-containing protein [Sphingomicrobium lutaoense]MBB3764449.1 hypothetical protein [Sphingomicrobium lutaoense]
MHIVTTSLTALSIGLAAPAASASLPQESQSAATAQAPALSPERRALALDAVDLYWPEGEAEYVVNYMLDDFATMMLDTPIKTLARDFGMTELIQAFGVLAPIAAEEAGEASEELPTTEQMEAGAEFMLAMFGDKTLRGILKGEDEHFDERFDIVRDVLKSELPPVFDKSEPKMRAVLAELFAEKFTDSELRELAAFADTAAGQKFVHTNWTASFEPTFYRAVFAGLPDFVEGMPGLVETLEARTAHLPPMFPEPEIEACEEGEEDCAAHEDTPEHLEEMAEELEAEAAELRARAAEMRTEAAGSGE